MEDKKVLNNEELEKVSGGNNHEFEFGKDIFATEDKKALHCGIDGNNAAPSGGGIFTEEKLRCTDQLYDEEHSKRESKR